MEKEIIRLYPHRPGVGLDPYLEVLQAEPKVRLTADERNEVLRFESVLARGQVEEQLMVEFPETFGGLEPVWRMKVKSTDFALEYFLTEEGQKNLGELLQISADSLGFENVNQARNFLFGLDYARIPAEKLDALAGKSVRFGQKQMVDAFSASDFVRVDEVPIPTMTTVVRNPADLATKAKRLYEVKETLKTVSANLGERTDSVAVAERALVTVYARRVNELLAAEIYPAAVALITQQSVVPTTEGQAAVEILQANLVLGGFIEGRDRHAMLARLDKFANGAGENFDSKGNLTPISRESATLGEEMRNSRPTWDNAEMTAFGVSQGELDQIRVGFEEMQSWVKDVLRVQGRLSSQTTYDPDREGRAEDGLWQVVPENSKGNLAANRRQWVVKVPGDFDRPIASVTPPGAIPVIQHEFAHVAQIENKQLMGLVLLENIDSDRSSIMAEAGAVNEERRALAMFGRERPTNPHYLAAVERRIEGGTLPECAQSFYESLMATDPLQDTYAAAKLAFDRTARIFRGGGRYDSDSSSVTDSQPLVYLEQELLARQLENRGLEQFLMVSGLSVQTLAELHAVDLIDSRKIEFPEQRPAEILRERVEAKIKAFREM